MCRALVLSRDMTYVGSLFRDGPLEKLWGGGGEEFFEPRQFFRYQIPF